MYQNTHTLPLSNRVEAKSKLKNLRKKTTLIIVGMVLLNLAGIGFFLMISSYVSLYPNEITTLKQIDNGNFSISVPYDWKETITGGTYLYKYGDSDSNAIAEVYVILNENPVAYFESTKNSVLNAMISDKDLLVASNFVIEGSTRCSLAFEYQTTAGSDGMARNCTVKTDYEDVEVQIAIQSKRDGESVWYVSRVQNWYWQENRNEFREIISSLEAK